MCRIIDRILFVNLFFTFFYTIVYDRYIITIENLSHRSQKKNGSTVLYSLGPYKGLLVEVGQRIQ